jgi:putative heme-binding domain-containing protein
MNTIRLSCFSLITVFLGTLLPSSEAQEFQNLFDGKSLQGWKGAEGLWSVSDGSIVGQTTAEKPTQGNTFLIWQGGDVADFEFSCQVKFEGNNSGVQYRSEAVDEAGLVLKGYQADLHPKPEYFGMMYGEKLGKRGVIATRHQRVEYAADESKKVLAEVAPATELVTTEWNTLRIVAVGNRLVHLVNGVVTVDITDNHPLALASGKLGLQLHAGPPMKVEFKDLQYRPLAGDLAKDILAEAIAAFPKKGAPKDEPKASAKPNSNAKSGGEYAWVSAAPKPEWIWREDKTDNEPIFLRHKFTVGSEVKEARLYCTCDNGATLWLNGKEVGTAPDWGNPILLADAKKFVQSGDNQIAVKAHNRGGVAAFVFKLEIETAGGKKQHVLSSPDWKLSLAGAEGWQAAAYDDSSWNAKLKKMGAFGKQPWGVAGIQGPGGNSGGGRQQSGPLEGSELTVAKDFSAELLYTVPKAEQGSWVSICREPSGGFYACDQGDKGLFHLTVSEGGVEAKAIDLKVPESDKKLSGAQGLLWAFDSLWFHRNGGNLYRITDSNGDGQLDKVETQPSQTGGGEHGNHSLILDEKGEQIYVVGGNHAPIPPEEAIARKRVQSWDEDFLLSRMWDARGHARGKLAPGGWISRFDPKSKTHDLISIGFRNEYDAALNSVGDLFAYDADMEWDMGSYWYRPTRINFVASGSDHGWRSGTGKWPTYYEDSLPPVVEIGPGSPTGVVAGAGAKFPEKFQRALFALDWTFGTIWAIHLEQQGAGYVGEKELFVAGIPLPVTDGAVGADGHLYFLIGGRGTQSALYRVSYTGAASTEEAEPFAPTPERVLARKLEAFHGVENPEALEMAWPHLGSEDRFLRHAARVAVESQPVKKWALRAVAEKDPQALIAAAVALARSGDEEHRDELLTGLLRLNPETLTESQKLGLLRAYALTFIRLGKPSEQKRAAILAELDHLLPSESADLNTELIRVLTYLQSPTVVSKTVKLIADRTAPEVPDWAAIAARNPGYGKTVQNFLDNAPPSREVYYAMMIASARKGWTLDARRNCIEVLNEAGKGAGGASFPGFLANIRDLHLGEMSNHQRTELADISGENFNPVPDFEIQPVEGPGQIYTLESASKHLNFKNAEFERGRSLFFSTSCGACHRLNGLGGDIGPDITSIPNKFDANYVLEAIIDPSKDISDQYSMFQVTLKNGSEHTGLYVENGDDVSIYPPDHTAEPIKVSVGDVKEVKQVPVSQMPPGLINMLNPEELRDLMAYLMSGGDKASKVYRK